MKHPPTIRLRSDHANKWTRPPSILFRRHRSKARVPVMALSFTFIAFYVIGVMYGASFLKRSSFGVSAIVAFAVGIAASAIAGMFMGGK